MKKCIFRWLPAVTMMTMIFIASSMPGNEVPEFGTIDLIVKKGGHMIGYALLAIACFFAAYCESKKVFRAAFLSLCLAIAYAASDEYHQSFTPGRSPSILDVGIDTVGAIIGTVVTAFFVKTRRR